MNAETTAKQVAKTRYGKHAKVLEYLGQTGDYYVFGLIDNDLVDTIEEPYYIGVDHRARIIEFPYIPYNDGASLEMPFEALEKQYGFYTKHKIFDY